MYLASLFFSLSKSSFLWLPPIPPREKLHLPETPLLLLLTPGNLDIPIVVMSSEPDMYQLGHLGKALNLSGPQFPLR